MSVHPVMTHTPSDFDETCLTIDSITILITPVEIFCPIIYLQLLNEQFLYIFINFVYFENGSRDEKAIWLGLDHDNFHLN